jgi:hypothetical protein
MIPSWKGGILFHEGTIAYSAIPKNFYAKLLSSDSMKGKMRSMNALTFFIAARNLLSTIPVCKFDHLVMKVK